MVTFEIKVFLKAYKRACKLTCLYTHCRNCCKIYTTTNENKLFLIQDDQGVAFLAPAKTVVDPEKMNAKICNKSHNNPSPLPPPSLHYGMRKLWSHLPETRKLLSMQPLNFNGIGGKPMWSGH